MLAQLDLDKIQNVGIPTFQLRSGGRDNSFSQIFSIILPYVFGAAGIILLFMLITAGYQIIFSKGDPKAMEVAKGKITTSIIGIVILFASFWIVRILGEFLGISVFGELFN